MRFIEKIQKSGILKDILVIAVLFLITFGLFGQTLMLGFLSDDYDFLEEAAKCAIYHLLAIF